MHNHSPLPAVRPDTLRWAIFLALLAPAGAFAEAGLEPATGPAGNPLINNDHGVPVIDIVPPNASGLSHNQFHDYNVAQAGVVLNNALHDGQSQLAGALAANPQFQGQAASTILNEVISSNASLIAGPQEIFGRPADYILANPNGITLNGGSFINTTRAGFVVGTPELQEEQLRHFSTLSATGALHVLHGGQSNAAGALDLIAPQVTQHGLLSAKDDLNLVAGRNRIAHADGQVLEHLPGTASSIDASLFGAMRAGRIRVVSTAEGAGVRTGAVKFKADDGIAMHSAGSLEIAGDAGDAAELLSDHGALQLSAADDLRMSAVQGRAGTIEVKAGKALTLDAKTRENIAHDRDNWSKKFLFITRETYARDTATTERQQHGVQLQASDSLAMQSGADMRLRAADVRAGAGLTMTSGGNLDIVAGVDSAHVSEQLRHRKDLWRGDRDTERYTEFARPSTLTAERMNISAKDTLNLEGSRLHSDGDMTLEAQQVKVGATSLQHRSDDTSYRGDLLSGTFFGARKGHDSEGNSLTGSSINVGGKLDLSADQVTISGSTVHGQQDAVLYSKQGALTIEAEHANSRTTARESDSKLFGLFASKRENTQAQQQLLVSDIASASNLRLASAEELRIQGAKVEAGKHLQVEAKGDVSLGSAQAVTERLSSDHQRGLTASAKQTQSAEDGKPDSRQYSASVGYEVTNQNGQVRETTQTASVLKGATVALASQAHLRIDGSKVEASAGDLALKGQQVALGATRNEREAVTRTSQSGGGLTVTGGIDRLGSLFEGHHNSTQLTERDSSVQRSEVQASGNLTIDTDALLTEAARVNAGEALQVNAKRIENRAVQDTHEREEVRSDWSASLGASVEYRDVTRPIERLVMGEEAARFQQAAPEDAMVAPSVGADMTVEHLKRLETQRRGIAQVSELGGAQVHVQASSIDDQATAWRANAGTLQIAADQHSMRAAENTQGHGIDRLAFAGDLRVDTSTGSDVNVRATGKGGSLDQRTASSTAVPGSLYGQQGIQIQLGSDGRYEGTRFDGGAGDVVVHSGGTLSLSQANDSTERQASQLDGNAWAKVGNRPAGTGLDGRGYLDQEKQQAAQQSAQVAQIDAKGDVRLSSVGDLVLEGTRIGSREAQVGDIALHSQARVQVLAASNSQTASGSKLGGGLELSAKLGETKGGALGGHFTHGKQDEAARQAVDALFDSRATLTVSSAARDDIAVHLQGLQASAERIELDAGAGGMLIEGSSDQQRVDNLEISAGAGFDMAKGGTDTRGLHARAKVDLDKRDNLTWNNSTLRADDIALQSLGDTRIEAANLEAGRITGAIDGDLRVASRKDNVNTVTVAGDARLSHERNPQGYINAAAAVAGPLGGKVKEKAGSALGKADPGFSPTLELEVSHQVRDSVAQQTLLKASDGIALSVGGEAHLVGARLQSAQGTVALDAAATRRETLSGTDYRRDVSVDGSNSLVDLGSAIADIAKGKGAASGENALDLGLLRTSGHNRIEQWASSVQGRGE